MTRTNVAIVIGDCSEVQSDLKFNRF